MWLRKTCGSSHLSISSPAESAVSTFLILLLMLSVLTLAERDFTFFNTSSLIAIPNTTWDLNSTKEVTFKTCSDSGNLISMNGSLTSSTSSTSSPNSQQNLAILLRNSSVLFQWNINGNNGYVYVGNSINKSMWYTISLRYLAGYVQFNLFQGFSTVVESVVVANVTYNSFLLNVRLSGTLKIGESFSGCMYQGPGVNFSALGFTLQNIIWDYCPLTTNYACANAFNGCAMQPCMNNGTCIDQQGANTTSKFKCNCTEGYTGVTCESTIDMCRTNPCEQGTCVSGINKYTCNCTGTGFWGDSCSNDTNECLNTTICGSYNCFNRPGGFTCDCPPGFEGVSCKEINECLSSPCKNGGNCTDAVNAFSCSCAPGYTGSSCEQNINDCESVQCGSPNTKCLDLVNGYNCVCIDGYTGSPCQDINECVLNYCQNNSTCSNTVGGYICSCLPGYTGKNCTDIINTCNLTPCLNNATCSDGETTYNCTCRSGFTGRNCEIIIGSCVNSQCRNQGFCRNQVGGYTCDCKPGWTGTFCEADVNECESSPCLNGAQCQNLFNTYNCTCPIDFEGLNCGRKIDDCNKTDPCQNGAECFDGINDYSCKCTSDWMGKNCSEVYDACSYAPCLFGANCTTVKPQHNYTCNCLPGFTGVNCEVNIDDCKNNSCQWYQQCHDEIGNFSCGCPVGYTGSMCDTEINECETFPCKNNGTCTNLRGNYTCTCPSRYIDIRSSALPKGLFLTGYGGRNCEDIDECKEYNDPPICQAQGMCQNSPPGGFTCYCKSVEGQLNTGILCEQARSYCDIRLPGQACLNGGTCVDFLASFQCNCVPGFTGTFCETNIDECASSPCQYNGTCVDHVNGYSCECIDGITGQNCETNIDDCSPDPCSHGGICQDHIHSFTCDCSNTGFNGTTCENNIDDCVGNTCQNGGQCIDGVKTYTCSCLPAYTGSRCEVDIPECTPNPCAFNSRCLEKSDISLYDKGNPHFVNFTFEKAAGYYCDCVSGVKGDNCTEDINECLSGPQCTPGLECLSGPCQNNATCTNIFKDGFICNCSRGYNGSLCENIINYCLLYRPCKNGGRCLNKTADYDCICPTPVAMKQNYAGKNCTTYLSGCDGPRRCRNGVCIPNLINDVHSFECDCYPGNTGRFCTESTDMSFRGGRNDYIRSQMNASEFNLSLRFQTTISDSMLVLWKLSATDYVSIELRNGMIYVRNRIQNMQQPCTMLTLSAVNNSEYHELDLFVTNNMILVTLPLDRCTESYCSTLNCQMSLAVSGNLQRQVSQVYIGSGIASGIQDNTLPIGFVGCMEDVLINGSLYYPGRQTGQYVGVSAGCSRTDQCMSGSCSGHGFCNDLWDSYVCQCYRPNYGGICENVYQPATFGVYEGTVATYTDFFGDIDNWSISFFIVTTQQNGFIVYFGNRDFEATVLKRLTFVGIYIKNGILSGDFYKCGYSFHFDTSHGISDGQKHFLFAEVKPTSFKVILDSQIVFQNLNVGNSSAYCLPQSYGFLVTLVNIGNGTVTSISREKRDVDWFILDAEMMDPFELPHQRRKRQVTSSNLLTSFSAMPQFEGVIQDVQVNKLVLSLDVNNSDNFTPPSSLNVTPGEVSTRDVCQSSLCVNGGTCSNVFYNDFNCTCPRGFTGKNCSMIDHCAFGTCPAESSCQNLQEGYECISTASFSTDNSIITYSITGALPEPVLTFDFRTRGLYGLIFLLRKGDYFLKVRVADGRLEINWKLSSDFSVSTVTRRNKPINNGVWYHVKFEVSNETNLTLEVSHDDVLVDDTAVVNLAASNFSFNDMLKNGEIVLGSSGFLRYSREWEAGYNGCLREVRLGGELMPFYKDSTFQNNTAINKFEVQNIMNIVSNCVGKDSCAGHSCLNKGNCVDLWNDYKCDCPAGFEGSMCEDNPDNCAIHPCMNGGVCVDGLGTYTCTCPKSFSGDICQNEVNLCSVNNASDLCANNSTCVDLGNDFTCNCTDQEYTGWYCNVPVRQNCNEIRCQNEGTCSNTSITLGAETNVTSFNCSCRLGYEGQLCEKEIDYCSINGLVCANNGQCINQPNTQNYSCNCSESLDFTGANCTEKINNCIGAVCNNGTCLDGVRNFSCLCNDGYTNITCDTVTDICQNRSMCQHGFCNNGFCNCADSGWEGSGCQRDFNECNATEPVCFHDGNCTNLEGWFNCSCSLGYEGHNCSTPNCSNICVLGTCQTNETDWSCKCEEYVQDQLCDNPGPCYGVCEKNKTVTCIQSTQFNNYSCICKTGWGNINCTDDVDECTENIAECHNGTCINTNGSYTCNCWPGYTGQYCNVTINECDPNPCHGGTCKDEIANFTCICDITGYQGHNCSENINECIVNTTICNSGHCIDLDGSYKCNCSNQNLGLNCEFENPCYNNTMCSNGGVCQYNYTHGAYEHHCQCAGGFEGVNCEKQSQSPSSGPDLGVIIGPIVGGVVLIILIIVIVAFIMTARSKRATRGAYSPSQQETSGSRVEMGSVLKKPPEERLI